MPTQTFRSKPIERAIDKLKKSNKKVKFLSRSEIMAQFAEDMEWLIPFPRIIAPQRRSCPTMDSIPRVLPAITLSIWQVNYLAPYVLACAPAERSALMTDIAEFEAIEADSVAVPSRTPMSFEDLQFRLAINSGWGAGGVLSFSLSEIK